MRKMRTALIEREQRFEAVHEISDAFQFKGARKRWQADRAKTEACFEEHEVEASGGYDCNASAKNKES